MQNIYIFLRIWLVGWKIVDTLQEIFLREKKKLKRWRKNCKQKILGAEGWNADDHLLWNYI